MIEIYESIYEENNDDGLPYADAHFRSERA